MRGDCRARRRLDGAATPADRQGFPPDSDGIYRAQTSTRPNSPDRRVGNCTIIAPAIAETVHCARIRTSRTLASALDDEARFATKIPLQPGLSVRRDDRHEQRSRLDLTANLLIPGISASQLALIKPHLDTRRPQTFADALRRIRILRGVAQEHRLGGITTAHDRFQLDWESANP